MDAVLVGIIVGFITTGLLWFVTRYLLAPRLYWSPEISKRPSASTPSGHIFQVKVKNVSRMRAIANIRMEAYVVVKGLDPEARGNSTRISLGISAAEITALFQQGNRLFAINTEDLTSFIARRLCDYGKEAIVHNSARSLDELLDLGSDGYFYVAALMTDASTGVEHYRESDRYTASDIHAYRFEADEGKFNEEVRNLGDKARKAVRRRRRRASRKRHRTLLLNRSRPTMPERESVGMRGIVSALVVYAVWKCTRGSRQYSAPDSRRP